MAERIIKYMLENLRNYKKKMILLKYLHQPT